MISRRGRRTGAEALVESLAKAGAEVAFGYPGGNVLDVFDCLRTAAFRFVLGRHEQGCVHMADGYARASGRPGVVIVTSGPGLTNTITGLGAANMDGIPLILICGQVPLDQIGTDAFQEADTTGLTRAVTKHNFLVKSADEIPETIAQAFYIATHGKPGPVAIDIPRDCQQALTSARFPERISLRAYHPEHSPRPRDVNRLAKLLNEAKRPLIYAGGGVIGAEAADDVAALSEKAGIPVATTMMGIGSVDERGELALGMAGMHGSSAANRAIAEADVILALGVRFNDRVTCARRRFAPQAKLIHVDCDPSAIDKNVLADLGIVADIKDLLTVANSRLRPAAREAWRRRVAQLKAGGPEIRVRSRAIRPQSVVGAVNRAVGGGAVIVTDVGQHQLWAARHFQYERPRHFITSGGIGAMGFGIPAAIGAAIARPDCRVVAMIGDGGAQMTSEELIVAAELKLPIAFVVFVNGTLGLVRQMQRVECGGRYFATELKSPDFCLLAKAHGIRAIRVTEPAELDRAVRQAVRSAQPVLLEVQVDADENA